MTILTAKTEDSPEYCSRQSDDATIREALRILAARQRATKATLEGPEDVKAYLRLQLADAEFEQFGVMFLDAQHSLIEFEILFRGTLSQTSVYPREVLKRALALNAAAVILAHNHPSGSVEPSRADEHLTQSLKASLKLVDVRVVDHVVVSRTGARSLAEMGLV